MKLTSSERELFTLVAHAAFSNPFSQVHPKSGQKTGGSTPTFGGADQLQELQVKVSARLEKLEHENRCHLGKYDAEDQRLLRPAILFEIFHRFTEPFQLLIQQQLRAKAAPCRVPFAVEAIPLFISRGIAPAPARGYFAMFYQVHRATYFIEHNLIGRSPGMRELRHRLWNHVFSHDIELYEQHLWNRMEDFSILLQGETGTGKGAAAAALGHSGFIPFDEKQKAFARSFTGTFVSLNLSQFPESLIESELFGHRKGAFAGAFETYEGVLARCPPQGVALLDEVGNLSPHLQIKLLQLLQERIFSPVGGHEPVRFNGRIMAATSQPLDELRERGSFRNDLYYRLCSDVITMPTLRQRLQEDPSELEELVAGQVERIAGKPSRELTGFVLERLRDGPGARYAWPGNVRELEQATRRILLTRDYAGDLRTVTPDLSTRLKSGLDRGDLDADSLLSGYCRLLHDRFGTYEEVARRTGLDRRTAKKYVQARDLDLRPNSQ